MKYLFLSFVLAISAQAGLANVSTTKVSSKKVPRLDIEMTGYEYKKILESKLSVNGAQVGKGTTPEEQAIERWLEIGKRNLDWVTFVNSTRSAQNKISFSSEATAQGAPVSNPKIYNFQIIQERWQVLETLLPKSMKAVLWGASSFPTTVPVTDREFTEWGLQVDSAYQIAARYKMMLPYLGELTMNAAYDVRGYLVLAKATDLDGDLNSWSQLSDAKKARYTKALVMICMNNEIAKADCVSKVQDAITQNTLVFFKNDLIKKAKENYDGFFVIPKFRSDASWPVGTQELRLPFVDPQNQAVKDYLQVNIEDEYRWNGWVLKLDFVPQDLGNTTHIEFQPGATPHVNDLAGSIITMDANAPLSEYDVQWTIRHEYGHVLGFPDCYIEFYDDEQEAFVAYQLDITNLMCSRRGHLKQEHFDELKRVYNK